jgi:hypothetical protein
MRLRDESLICVAMLDNVLGVVEGRKPVEPRSKSLSNKGSAAGMMPAGSFMNISEKGDSILGCYAPLENPCGAVLVEFSVDYHEGLGTLHDLSTMDGVFWEFASYQVGQVWLRPNCLDEHDCGCFLGWSSVPAAGVGLGWLTPERLRRKTPSGIGKHFDPMLAKLSASSLLSLPIWVTSHLSKLPSSLLYIARYAIMFVQVASHSFMTCWAMSFESLWILMRVAPQALAIRIPCRTALYSASLFEGSQSTYVGRSASCPPVVIRGPLLLLLPKLAWTHRHI